MMTKFANKKVICNKLRTNSYPGLLRLQIYDFPGALTVNVIEAKQLVNCVGDAECNPFIRIRLIPDPSNRINCTTLIEQNTNNPKYNEKFSFEICRDDLDRRLLITAYHFEPTTNLRNLYVRSKQAGPEGLLQGWFYLLPDELGQSKHRQISAHAIESARSGARGVSEMNQDMVGLQNLVARIPRAQNGYGLSVAGNCPCRITRVSHANFNRNVHVGDFIVAVNGRNVSRATLSSVVKLIRKLDAQELVLNLCRHSNLPRLELQRSAAAPAPLSRLQHRTTSGTLGGSSSSTSNTPKYLLGYNALSNRLNNLSFTPHTNSGSFAVGHSEV